MYCTHKARLLANLKKINSKKHKVDLSISKNSKFLSSLPDQSSVLIPLCSLNSSDPSILLISRPKSMTYLPEIVTFPGGKFDSSVDSNLLDTAKRETFEEIGLVPDDFEIWSELPFTLPNIEGNMGIKGFIGAVNPKMVKSDADLKPYLNSLKINKNEVDEFFKVNLSTFTDPDNYKIFYYDHRPETSLDSKGETWGYWKGPVYEFAEGKSLWGIPAIQLNFVLHCLGMQEILTGYSKEGFGEHNPSEVFRYDGSKPEGLQ